MTETSKLAEEAAVEIHWAHVKKPDAYEQEAIARTRTIIKSAIEKATKELVAKYEELAAVANARYCGHCDLHYEEAECTCGSYSLESRAAHASEQGQEKWTKKPWPHGGDSWDVYCGEKRIVADLTELECDQIIDAHNAALRSRRRHEGEAVNTDQIAAEAAKAILEIPVLNEFMVPDMAAIIQTAIEKAELSWRSDELERAIAAERYAIRLEHALKKATTSSQYNRIIKDSHAAHASEQVQEKWTKEYVERIAFSSGHASAYELIADAHNAALQPRDSAEDTKRLDIMEELWSEKSLSALDYGHLKHDTLRQTIDDYAAMKSEGK